MLHWRYPTLCNLGSFDQESFTLPTEGSMVSVTDINHDGKEDLVVHYGRQDAKEMQRKVIVFVAQ